MIFFLYELLVSYHSNYVICVVCVFYFQYKLGNALNRVAFYYAGISSRGGTAEMSVDECNKKAIETISKAIEIFQDVSMQFDVNVKCRINRIKCAHD
jgi:hypothetical protein